LEIRHPLGQTAHGPSVLLDGTSAPCAPYSYGCADVSRGTTLDMGQLEIVLQREVQGERTLTTKIHFVPQIPRLAAQPDSLVRSESNSDEYLIEGIRFPYQALAFVYQVVLETRGPQEHSWSTLEQDTLELVRKD
jgi:hypothetical protein